VTKRQASFFPQWRLLRQRTATLNTLTRIENGAAGESGLSGVVKPPVSLVSTIRSHRSGRDSVNARFSPGLAR